MKRWIVAAAIAALSLGGCQKADGVAGEALHGKGRYVGVGLYAPSRMWEQVVVAEADGKTNPAAARPADDDEIIVVLDSNTGELRQCGNFSGACIAMSPWARALATSHNAPVLVGKHAGELDERGPEPLVSGAVTIAPATKP